MEEDKKRRTPKRLVIDIPEEMHNTFKVRAAGRGITLKKWVLRALVEALRKEDSYNKK